jgi:transcriptional regulator with XRE-family HTH domain
MPDAGRPTQKIFGKKLKAARESLLRDHGTHLTQGNLAKLIGLSESRIGSIEQSDVTGIEPKRIVAYAAALRCTVETFLKKFAPEEGENKSAGDSLPQPIANIRGTHRPERQAASARPTTRGKLRKAP